MDMCGQSPMAISDVHAQKISPELKLHFDLDWLFFAAKLTE